jgi:hypothetical protein
MAFLGEVEGWLPQDVERVDTIIDNLGSHHATDGLLLILAHSRWERCSSRKTPPTSYRRAYEVIWAAPSVGVALWTVRKKQTVNTIGSTCRHREIEDG